jgi:hypothetical protein
MPLKYHSTDIYHNFFLSLLVTSTYNSKLKYYEKKITSNGNHD